MGCVQCVMYVSCVCMCVCMCVCVMRVCVCVCVCVWCVQAYRLEPLVNEAYANIRPVKIDSAGSKPSKTALDHAEGPKSDQMLAAPSGQSGSWMSSLINAVTNPKKQAPESKQDKDKVVVCFSCAHGKCDRFSCMELVGRMMQAPPPSPRHMHVRPRNAYTVGSR